MSTLTTLTKFYYGHTVTIENQNVDFDEGGPEIKGVLRVGSYSLDEYRAEWQRMLRTFGTQDYVVTVDRDTGIMTVTAPLAFSLLAATGTRIGTGAWTMAGFDAVDQTGTSISGDFRSGKIYRPQYLLHNYASVEHFRLKESAAVNVSANGEVQTLQFGDGSRMKCNIIAITDKLGLKVDPWFENANGVADALDFLNYLITKGTVEFMPDVDAPNNFVKLLLDSTQSDRQGTGFELKNMRTKDVYETGDLVFRKVLT